MILSNFLNENHNQYVQLNILLKTIVIKTKHSEF
jgi:ribosomal protein S8E